jgi:hypothetical protein
MMESNTNHLAVLNKHLDNKLKHLEDWINIKRTKDSNANTDLILDMFSKDQSSTEINQ